MTPGHVQCASLGLQSKFNSVLGDQYSIWKLLDMMKDLRAAFLIFVAMVSCTCNYSCVLSHYVLFGARTHDIVLLASVCSCTVCWETTNFECSFTTTSIRPVDARTVALLLVL